MKLALLSDIHCNLPGLERGLELMAPFDEVLCAGDSVFQFRWSNEVVARLRELGAHLVLGNHEETILSPDGERAVGKPGTDPELVEWMRSRPYRLDLEFDGLRILMIHSSPWEPWRDYHYPHESIWARAADLDCDVLVVGHTHFKMAKTFGSVLVVNPGSAGDPRDHNNDFQLSCATLDTTTKEVTFYDYPDPTRSFVKHSGQL
ncbi:MAG: metallophosphoesterase family protein [Dehalococcoidia bacterium]